MGPESDDSKMNERRLLRREDGQTMAEYSVILAVITPAIVLAIALMATGVADNLLDIVGFLNG
jgi:Flp pilus assembly pilin Flp